MKQLMALLALASLISCTNQPDARSGQTDSTGNSEEIIEATTVPIPDIKASFPQIYEYLVRQDPSFTKPQFDSGLIQMADTTPPQPVTEKWISSFYPYLVFNSDSTLAIDYVSGNFLLTSLKGKSSLRSAGPDMEVALIQIKEKTRKRILFLGTMANVLDAVWKDNKTIIIAGSEEVDREQIKPLLWQYEYGQDTIHYFPALYPLHARVNNFTEEKLNRGLEAKTSPSF